MRRRAGYSLIEMLVVISMSGMILAVAVGLLHNLLRLDKTSRDHLVRHQTLARLEADFRDDARAAVKLTPMEVAAGGKKFPGWEFQFPEAERKVTYHAASEGLVREEHAGSAARRDGYRLPAGGAASVHLESGPPQIASLRIDFISPPGEPYAGPPIRIDAALGSDQRFAKLGGPRK